MGGEGAQRGDAAFFDRLGAAGCARIELVTEDLAASYQKAVRARVPQARVVSDRFHVEQLAADAVDEVRRAEQHRLGAPARKALKGMRYALLKRPDRLKPGEVRRLAALRRENRALDRAYELKEYLATITAELGERAGLACSEIRALRWRGNSAQQMGRDTDVPRRARASSYSIADRSLAKPRELVIRSGPNLLRAPCRRQSGTTCRSCSNTRETQNGSRRSTESNCGTECGAGTEP